MFFTCKEYSSDTEKLCGLRLDDYEVAIRLTNLTINVISQIVTISVKLIPFMQLGPHVYHKVEAGYIFTVIIQK